MQKVATFLNATKRTDVTGPFDIKDFNLDTEGSPRENMMMTAEMGTVRIGNELKIEDEMMRFVGLG